MSSYDILVKAKPKMPLEKACKFVAKILSDEEYQISGKKFTPTWKNIQIWRYDITRKENPPPRQLTEIYEKLKNDPSAYGRELSETKRAVEEKLPEITSKLATLG